MSWPDWDRPEFDGLDPEMLDWIESGMLREPVDRLVEIANRHLGAIEADVARGCSGRPRPAQVRTVVRAMLTIACSEATDVDAYRRRERLFARGRVLVDDAVAHFLRSTLWRDRVRLVLASGVRRTPV